MGSFAVGRFAWQVKAVAETVQLEAWIVMVLVWVSATVMAPVGVLTPVYGTVTVTAVVAAP